MSPMREENPFIIVNGEKLKAKLILFDVDGTLVDDRDRYKALAKSRMRAIENASSPETSRKWAELEGVNVETLEIDMNGPLSKAPRREDLIVATTAFYLTGKPWYAAKELAEKSYQEADRIQSETYTPRFFNGVHRTLEKLKDRGFKLGVVTNGQTNLTADAFESMGVDTLFDVIVGADMVTETKPSPEGILKACELMKVKPVETLYIGDQLTDVVAGLNAQVKHVIRVGEEAEGSKFSVSSVADLA